MSLLGRLDAALLRRHQRTCPWLTGSGAVTTRAKGATMTSKAPESDPQPLTGSERPLAPEAPETARRATWEWALRDWDTDPDSGDHISDLATACMAVSDVEVGDRDAEIKANRLWISALEDTIEMYKADITEALATIARMRTGRP